MTGFKKILEGVKHIAEFINASMLAVVFITFLLQIFSRYVLRNPFGWTLELCLTLWLWIVFFGNSSIVREKDQVKFDILFLSVNPRLQKIMGLVGCVAIIIGFLWSLPATWEYVNWMKIRKSAILKIPLRSVFFVYMIFLVAIITRYTYRLYLIFTDHPSVKTDHEFQVQSLE